MEIKKGTIAICGIGAIGLITEDEPREVTYRDGNKQVAYVGIHLTDKVAPIGSPWSSKHPTPIIGINELVINECNLHQIHIRLGDEM